MNLAKAIELFTGIVKEPHSFYTEDDKAAAKLLIKAGEWHQDVIRAGFKPSPRLLPGETED